MFANGAYSRTLSQRTTVGFNVAVNRTQYDDSSDHSTIITPTVNIRTQLSEFWDVRASVGASFSSSERAGQNNHSTGLSVNSSVCHNTETERLCGRATRNSTSLSRGALVTTTTVGVDWFKELDDKQTVQLSASASRYSSDDELVEQLQIDSSGAPPPTTVE